MLPEAEEIVWTSADGLKLFARAYGPADAPLTALCIHGLTRNGRDFEPMIAALPPEYRYVAVDVRGRGRSTYDPDPNNYHPKFYARDMIALLDHLSVAKVALIGTSMGGLISMMMARKAPDRIAGIALNDIGPEIDKRGVARISAYAGKVAPVTDWESAAASVKAIQGAAFPDMPDEGWLDFARRTFRQDASGAFVADYDPAIAKSFGKAKPGPLLNFIMWRLFKATRTAPLLILRGELSDILSGETAEKMVKQHPAARLVTVPRVGHAPLLDEPASVAALSDFLRRLDAWSRREATP